MHLILLFCNIADIGLLEIGQHAELLLHNSKNPRMGKKMKFTSEQVLESNFQLISRLHITYSELGLETDEEDLMIELLDQMSQLL
jgi:hypothetical protein